MDCVGVKMSEEIKQNEYFCDNCKNERADTVLLLSAGENLITEEPKSVKEAKESDNWKEWESAIEKEIQALYKNNTWDLVQKRPNVNILKNKWVFKIKLNGNGTVDRYRARLVVKGCQQRAGFDYNETFSPVVRFDSIRIILKLSTIEGMFTRQFDVKTAFLHGTLDENVYMVPPEGVKTRPNEICKLKKSLYGLKQSPRCWNQKFINCIKEMGLKPTDSDPCVFRTSGDLSTCVILAIYVDDGIIIPRQKKKVEELLQKLKENFEVKISDLNMFLGIRINNNEDNSKTIHQAMHTEKILSKFNMEHCNPISIPADNYQDISMFNSEDGTPCSENIPYREAVGSLLFLSMTTRLDITFAVNNVSKFCANPRKIHWNAVKRIFRYLYYFCK